MRSIEKTREELAAAEKDFGERKVVADQTRQQAHNAERNYQIAAMKVTVCKEVLVALEEDEDDGDNG